MWIVAVNHLAMNAYEWLCGSHLGVGKDETFDLQI